MHASERIPPAAYAPIEFVSETLDWMNPWHYDAAYGFHEDLEFMDLYFDM